MNYIECCFINRLNGSDRLFCELEKQPDIKVTTFNCLGNCHVCSKTYHCIVNGVRVSASTEAELQEQISKYIIKK